MAEKKSEKIGREREVAGVDPDVVDHVVETAEEQGLPPSVAKEILQEGVEEGVAPEKLEEVVDEAVLVERQDRLGKD
jgi:hypothetical protein